MKNLILLITLISLSQNAYCQFTGDKEIIWGTKNFNADTTIHYLQLTFVNTSFGNKQSLIMDCGCDFQYDGLSGMDAYKFKDNTGTIRKFNTIIEGLNYFYNRGWEVKNVWNVPSPGSISSSFLLERKQ